MSKFVWNDELRQKLIELRERGMTDEAIHEAFGTPSISVVSKERKRLGFAKLRNWEPGRHRLLVRLLEEGKRLREISPLFPERTYSAVSAKIREIGWRSTDQYRGGSFVKLDAAKPRLEDAGNSQRNHFDPRPTDIAGRGSESRAAED